MLGLYFHTRGIFVFRAFFKNFFCYFTVKSKVYKRFGYKKLSVCVVENNYSLMRIPLRIPSWVGLFVIFIFPSAVSTIVPFVKIFCRARKRFEGVSRTFFISTFLLFPFI